MAMNKKYIALYTSLARYFFVYGGRGSGKSYAVAEFLLRLTYEVGHVILFTRYTMKSAEISIIPEFKSKIIELNAAKDFEVTSDHILNKRSGSRLIFRGIKTSEGIQTANLKSIKGLTTWVLDEAEELHNEDVFDKIDESIRAINTQNRVIFILNPTLVSHWIYKRFFASLPEFFTGQVGNTEYIYTSYLENLKNLAASFVEKGQILKSQNSLKYKCRYLGAWAKESSEALWRFTDITYKQPSELKRICVAIDPAVTSNLNSDETGLVVCGIDSENKGYVLEDCSGVYRPEAWAKLAVNLYHKHKADFIVAEVNQGGDLVKQIIRQFDSNAKVVTVHANKGKYTRAEPVASLYSENKVFHIKPFTQLEEQMITWQAMAGEKSPDRIDALVYGLTKLLLTKQLVTS
jgi:phage terminase large subunit